MKKTITQALPVTTPDITSTVFTPERVFETLFETEDQFFLYAKNPDTLLLAEVYESALKLNQGSLLRYILLSIEHAKKSLFDIYHQAFIESTRTYELELFLKNNPEQTWNEQDISRSARRVNVTILSHFLLQPQNDKTVHRALDYLMSVPKSMPSDLLYQTMTIFSTQTESFHNEETALLYLFSQNVQPVEQNYFSFLVGIREYKPLLYLPLLEQFDKYAQLWQNFTLHTQLSQTLPEKIQHKKNKI